MAPFEKENPTSSTLHILKLSSRCPTMDSLVKFDDMIELSYEFDKRQIMINLKPSCYKKREKLVWRIGDV